jgi:hypothetical protein
VYEVKVSYNGNPLTILRHRYELRPGKSFRVGLEEFTIVRIKYDGKFGQAEAERKKVYLEQIKRGPMRLTFS